MAQPDGGRRRFLREAAVTLGAAAAAALDGTAEARQREARQFAALGRGTAWINSSPLSGADLRGKVVLVQFGTYTCINWLRTLPYVRAWHQRYRNRMVFLGVHTPEFTFEKNLANVRRALQPMQLEFPIVVDNDYVIWRAFDNRYWPALYFIDARGRVRDEHFGEGEYERSERTIRRLLSDATGVAEADTSVAPITAGGIEVQADWRSLKSPEMYLGSGRAENFSSPGGPDPGRRRRYAAPSRMQLNQWALVGEWAMGNEAIVLDQAPGRIVCRFQARDVHLVMGPVRDDMPVRLRLTLDGQPPGRAHGVDVDEDGGSTVVEHRMHQLIRQPGPITPRTLDIEFLEPGAEAFAFTFG